MDSFVLEGEGLEMNISFSKKIVIGFVLSMNEHVPIRSRLGFLLSGCDMKLFVCYWITGLCVCVCV